MSAPRRPNLVASTTWSRRPASTSPSSSSDAPMPYTSAVSSRVIPASMAASTTARVLARSSRRPKLLQPSPVTDTVSPDAPSSRYLTSPRSPFLSPASPAAAAGRAALRIGPQPHRHPHRAALEPEFLTQPPLDEPPVTGLQEAGGEQHEMRRPEAGLGREQDLRLAAAPDGRRGGRDQAGQPGIEPAGRHPGLPACQRRLQRGHQPVQVAAGGGRDVDPGCPAGGVQLPVDLLVQPQA